MKWVTGEMLARPVPATQSPPTSVTQRRDITPASSAQKPGAARTRLLLEGPITSTLLRLAAPNLVVNVVLIAVTTSVDAYFVGQIDPSGLAGLALVFPVMMLMQQMANFSMGGALASAVARAIGAKRHKDAAALIIHGLVIACCMAALFTLVFLVAGPRFYALMGGNGSILAAAVEYSTAIFAGALAYWLLSTLTSVVRGTGQVGLLATVYVAAEVLHVLLVPALVFGVGPIPPLGTTGAGIATVTSFSLSTACSPGISPRGGPPSRCLSAASGSTGACSATFCASGRRYRFSLSSTTWPSRRSRATPPCLARRRSPASGPRYGLNI